MGPEGEREFREISKQGNEEMRKEDRRQRKKRQQQQQQQQQYTHQESNGGYKLCHCVVDQHGVMLAQGHDRQKNLPNFDISQRETMLSSLHGALHDSSHARHKAFSVSACRWIFRSLYH